MTPPKTPEVQKQKPSLSELKNAVKPKKGAVEKLLAESTAMELQFERLLRENRQFQEIVGKRKFLELVPSDFSLLSEKGMRLSEVFLQKNRIVFGKNPNLSGRFMADMLFEDVRVNRITCNGQEYIRKSTGFYLADTTKQGKKEEGAIDSDVPLTLRHGDTVGPIFDDMPSGMHSPEFQKLSETRRAETENDRVRLATDALLKAKKPTDIQPRSNSFTDIAAFFTVLESIFGNIFGDKKPQPGQEWTKEDSTKITEEIKDKKPIVDLKHAIPFDLIKSSGIQKSGNMPLCSKTVYEDANRLFDLTLPNGDASVVRDRYKSEQVNKKSGLLGVSERFGDIPEGTNFIDIFTTGKTKFGHRLIGFKQGEQWYVLDPYIARYGDGTPKSSARNEPILWQDYEREVSIGMNRSITKVAYYRAPKVAV